MISYVRGELVAVDEEKVTVDVNGIGYGVFMPAQSINMLPMIGSEVKLHTYLNVREDAMQLFGFLTKDDLRVFKLVIGVSGIGPKGGLSILSQLTPDELRFAVASHDVKSISATPGIGKKTAEKLIIELKDKLHLEEVLEREPDVASSQIMQADHRIQNEAVQALVSLGYSSSDALRAVKQVMLEDATTVEAVLKQALRFIM